MPTKQTESEFFMKYSIFTSHTEGINIDEDGGTVIYALIFVLCGKEYEGICLHVVLFNTAYVFKIHLSWHVSRFSPQTNIWAALQQVCKETIHDVISQLHHNYFP